MAPDPQCGIEFWRCLWTHLVHSIKELHQWKKNRWQLISTAIKKVFSFKMLWGVEIAFLPLNGWLRLGHLDLIFVSWPSYFWIKAWLLCHKYRHLFGLLPAFDLKLFLDYAVPAACSNHILVLDYAVLTVCLDLWLCLDNNMKSVPCY